MWRIGEQEPCGFGSLAIWGFEVSGLGLGRAKVSYSIINKINMNVGLGIVDEAVALLIMSSTIKMEAAAAPAAIRTTKKIQMSVS